MSAQYNTLLTPKLSPSPYNTPAIDSRQNTPYAEDSYGDLKYESEKPAKNWFGYGWRGGARIAFAGATLVLVVNVTLMVFMTVKYEKMDGFPVIFRGTCESARWQNTLWHFVLNVLSTGLLAASNYCMQLLSAPTRAHVDQAHAAGKWLDIGIPSLRNLRFLNWTRTGFWTLLCISSIPLHLVYNSTFYAAFAARDYNILYATEDFVNGSYYDAAKFPDTAVQNVSLFQSSAPGWQRLNNHDCIQAYANDFVTKYQNVIAVVTNSTNVTDGSLLSTAVQILPPRANLGSTYDSFAWICNDTETPSKTGVTDRTSAGFVPCAAQAKELMNIANSWWRSGGYHISYCVAEEIHPDCHLHFAPHLMGPVILMNLFKCIVAFYVAFRMVDVPLVTIGDAIESFIKHPDPTTMGKCLLDAHDASRTFSKSSRGRMSTMRPPQPFDDTPQRWHRVVTKRQWVLLMLLLVFMLLGLLVGIYFGTRNLSPPTLSNALSIWINQVQAQNLVLGANLPQLGASAVLVTALIANSPQAILSFLYMVYNTVFTLLFIGEDWDLFGAYTSTTRRELIRRKKTEPHRYLRVSDPKGSQKSTHTLNLPLRFAIPLMCVSGLAHWLMSSSLYLANISVIPRDGSLPRHDEITTVAYAPVGMVCLCVLIILMALAAILTGTRKFGGQMRIVGSNSAAISAACHVGSMSERRRREMVLRKIAWGEVPADEPETTGLGIASGPKKTDEVRTAVYSADDFSDDINERDEYHDVEGGGQHGYHVVRGQVEMVNMGDNTGYGKSSAVGHCTFSDGFLIRPTVGKRYA